jgi:hypothetical protein
MSSILDSVAGAVVIHRNKKCYCKKNAILVCLQPWVCMIAKKVVITYKINCSLHLIENKKKVM